MDIMQQTVFLYPRYCNIQIDTAPSLLYD